MTRSVRGCGGIRRAAFGRRHLLSAGGAGMLGLTLPRVLGAASVASLPVRARRVIFLFQWGGPSHLDTFDMKPDAPREIRGPLAPISSVVPAVAGTERHLTSQCSTSAIATGCDSVFTQEGVTITGSRSTR